MTMATKKQIEPFCDSPGPSGNSRLIQDPYAGHWIITAPERGQRPEGMQRKKVEDVFSEACLKHEEVLAVFGRGEKRITAIQNRFPIFRSHGGLEGRQEILVEGCRKNQFSKSSTARILALINAMADRSHVFRRDAKIKYVVAFKNEGASAGASQPHAHSQIFGLSFVPEQIKDMMLRRKHLIKTAKLSPHDLALMQATKQRVVYADKNVMAYATPLARLPYEVRIITRRAVDNITETSQEERSSLAKALFKLLKLVRRKKWSFNFYFHDTIADKNEHFEIVFTPRANVWAGFELDTGIVVNPVTAEMAAKEYRSAE